MSPSKRLFSPANNSNSNNEGYGSGEHGAPPGYTRILPRTSSREGSYIYHKRCETCSTAHDGSFGAGRFCSSRCARTVGGLANRKRRLMERSLTTNSRAGAKKKPSSSAATAGSSRGKPQASRHGRIDISDLLNPSN